MASNKNDLLNMRTVSGSVNLYDDQKCIGNAEDKTIAAMLGGHSYNIVNHREELYFPNLRHDSHFVDRSNVATMHWMDRKRRYPRDPRNHMKMSLQNPAEHPKVAEREQRRQEYRISQMENFQNYRDFQDRRRQMRPETPEARRTLNPTQKTPTAMRVTECKPLPKDMFLRKREQHAQSAPDLRTESLCRLNLEQRPEAAAHQLQTESANYAHCRTANTYAMSLSTTDLGERHKLQQSRASLQRAENYDFAMTRKNNNWSAEDKLLRADPYYMKPKLAITNNSVKYDILTNERKNFWY
jgi:hypothetical protein